MNAALLVCHWHVCDAAKTHVQFAFTHITSNTHRRERAASVLALRSAVEALTRALATEDPGEVPVPTAGAWGASLEQQAALEHVSCCATRYVAAYDRYQRTGSGLDERGRTLLALLRALDVITFYRNGPQLKVDDESPEDAPPLPSPAH